MAGAQQMSLGKRLQRERESHHWTQEQLAEKIGGSVPSINRWEHDRATPRQDMFTLLTEIFGKPPERWGTGKQIIWNIPFLRNPYFTGRDQTLLRLHRALAADNTVVLSQTRAISGLGGIGKTQTALEYAYRYANEYEAVLWVRADSHETAISDFAGHAMALDLPEKDETDQFLVITSVKRWLQEHGPWLLIFDNADELADVSDFLPRQIGGAVLLTTRSQIIGPHIKKIALDKMSREEGTTYLLRRIASSGDEDGEEDLLKRISDREQAAAQELWEVMDGLPLALDQAGAYIEAKQSSLTEYVELYRHHREALLRERGGLIPEHPDAVATTWSLSFQRVKQKNPAAAELLLLCAFLSPDAIPEELITRGAAHVTSSLQALSSSALLLNDAISTLHTYSLVRRDPATRMLSIHRLVQAVLQDALEETDRRTWAKRVMLTVNAAFPHPEHGTWPQCERLLPHALLAAHSIETYQIMSEEAGRLLHEMATYLMDRVRYSEAEPLFQRALQVREQCLGPEHPLVAATLNNLALLYDTQGKYAEAEPLYQHSLAIREQQLGPQHSDVAATLNRLAYLYFEQGKYAEAESFHLRSLAICEQHLEPEHLQVAATLNGIAYLYYEQGKYAEAEPLYQRGLANLERQLGPEHPQVAILLNNLANIYLDQGKYAEAEPLYQRALTIYEEQLGPEHPQVAQPLNNLAELYGEQGKYAEAESLYQRSLAIFEHRLGSEHPMVAHPLNGLAELYREQGKYTEAESLYLRALRIRERALGSQHLHTAESMYGLARLQDAQGNGEEARDRYARALAVREQTLGAHHPIVTETRSRFIALLHTMGQHKEVARVEAAQSEQGMSEKEQKIHPEE